MFDKQEGGYDIKMKKLHRKSVDRTRPSGDIKRLILYFTFIFWFCFLALQVVYYFRYGKSMVGRGDGVNQHMLTLVYIGQYLRAFLQNIFVDHQFVIPMFDFSIGYGMDIISTLHYYGFGDPLNYLAVFVSPEDTESLYAFLCGLRMFIAGLSFMVFMSFLCLEIPRLKPIRRPTRDPHVILMIKSLSS